MTWLLLGFWVTPAVAMLGLAIMVIASSRVQSLQAAHHVGSLMVLPIVVLLILQITWAFLLDPLRVGAMGSLLWAAAIMVRWLGSASLRRTRLAVRL